MIALLQILIFGHAHKWKVMKEVSVVDDEQFPIGTRYYCQCEKCGRIKIVK
jgi:hypothetical protein